LRKFLEKQGQTDIAREVIQKNTTVLDTALAGLAELVVTAVNIPEIYEGLGLGIVDLIQVFEVLVRALLLGALLYTLALAVPLLEKYGTEKQKSKYLPEIAAGNRTMTLAWLEPNGDYAPEDVQCTAVLNNNKLMVNGTKELVPDADLVDT